MTDARQTLDHLRAQIAFREGLAWQHVTGELLLPDDLDKEEHDRILRERGRARPAALVLVNEFGADGAAADISYHQLRTMEHFAELFGLPRRPLRLCLDANPLPNGLPAVRLPEARDVRLTSIYGPSSRVRRLPGRLNVLYHEVAAA